MRFWLLIALLLVLSACGKKEVRQTIPEEERPAEFVKYGDQFYQSGDYENAFRAYGYVYENYPTSREYIDAAIGLSRCYGALQDYNKGFDILHDLLKNNLIPTKVPHIYNAIAEFYERSAGISEELSGAGENDYRLAISYYQKAIQYPNSDDVQAKSYAQYKIGTLYERLDSTVKALEAYELAQNSYPGTEWALRAAQSISEINQYSRRRLELQQSGLLPDSTNVPQQKAAPRDTTDQ